MDRESKRDNEAVRDSAVPAQGKEREAQDRAKGKGPRSPVDSMHVEAPKQKDNEGAVSD